MGVFGKGEGTEGTLEVANQRQGKIILSQLQVLSLFVCFKARGTIQNSWHPEYLKRHVFA